MPKPSSSASAAALAACWVCWPDTAAHAPAISASMHLLEWVLSLEAGSAPKYMLLVLGAAGLDVKVSDAKGLPLLSLLSPDRAVRRGATPAAPAAAGVVAGEPRGLLLHLGVASKYGLPRRALAVLIWASSRGLPEALLAELAVPCASAATAAADRGMGDGGMGLAPKAGMSAGMLWRLSSSCAISASTVAKSTSKGLVPLLVKTGC